MTQRIMTQAIQTKFLGPTNTRGSRIRAWCEAKSIVVAWDHSLNQQDNHAAAARAVYEAMGWCGDGFTAWYGGSLPGDQGYAFVQPNAV